MYTVPTGRGPEIREVYEVTRCAGCQCRLAWPHTIMNHYPCSCVPGGHRSWYCFECGTRTYDPPHDEVTRDVVGGTSYFRA